MLVATRPFAPVIAIRTTGASAIGSLNPAVIRRGVPDFTAPVGEYVIAAVGTVASTVKVVLGPAAGALLRVSVAVPAAIEIPSVPSPLMLESVTVRVVVPLPETPTVALAVPVLFNVILPAASVTELAPP